MHWKEGTNSGRGTEPVNEKIFYQQNTNHEKLKLEGKEPGHRFPEGLVISVTALTMARQPLFIHVMKALALLRSYSKTRRNTCHDPACGPIAGKLLRGGRID